MIKDGVRVTAQGKLKVSMLSLVMALVLVLSSLPNWAMAAPALVGDISGLTLGTSQETIMAGTVKVEGYSGANMFWATSGQGEAKQRPEVGSLFSNLAGIYNINVSYNFFVPATAGNTISVVEVDPNNLVVGYTTLVVDSSHVGTLKFRDELFADPVMDVGYYRAIFASDLYYSRNILRFSNIVVEDQEVVSFEWKAPYGHLYPYFHALAIGTTNVHMEVEDTVTKDRISKTIQINVVSNNSKLSDLSITDGSLDPHFNSDVLNYTVNVSNDTEFINVTPTVAESNATVMVNGQYMDSGSESDDIELSVGNNTIHVEVKAQNGYTVSNYKITVKRLPSSNTNLDNLVTSIGTLDPIFTAGTTEYSLNVDNDVTSIKVTPTVADSNASVMVNGHYIDSGSESGDIELEVGATTIIVQVTAEDDITFGQYELTVNRSKSSNANLDNLVTSIGAMDPIFTAGTTDYSINVDHSVTSIKVTPTVAESNATVKVNGQAVASESESDDIKLGVGVTTIIVEVTAEDGITVNNYNLTVNRAKSSNANLDNLVTSAGTLDPIFTMGTTDYSLNVANKVTNITVTPTSSDSNATIYINDSVVVSGNESHAIDLDVGENIIQVYVMAEDGETRRDFSITVVRKAAAPAPTPTPVPTAVPAEVKNPFSSSVVKNVEQLVSTLQETLEANKDTKVTFADIASHWASDDIALATRLQIIKGYQDGSFKPDASVSRAEFSAMIVRAFHLEAGDKKVSFNDIAEQSWSKTVIEILASNGIISGYQNGTFKPNQEITHAEMVTIISRILNLKQLKDQSLSTPSLTDISSGNWAQEAMKDAMDAGLLHDVTKENFAPNNIATRAEVLSLIIRSLKTDKNIEELLK